MLALLEVLRGGLQSVVDILVKGRKGVLHVDIVPRGGLEEQHVVLTGQLLSLFCGDHLVRV